MRMHSHRCRIQYCVEPFGAQSTARNRFAASCARELLSCRIAARRNKNLRASTGQRKGSRSRRSARSKNQRAAAAKLHFSFQRSKGTDVIRVASIKRAILSNDNCIHSANLGGERFAIGQILQDFLLVRNCYAETVDPEFWNRDKKIFHILH